MESVNCDTIILKLELVAAFVIAPLRPIRKEKALGLSIKCAHSGNRINSNS